MHIHREFSAKSAPEKQTTSNKNTGHGSARKHAQNCSTWNNRNVPHQPKPSSLMRSRNMRLRNQFRQRNAREDEDSSRSRAQAEPLAHDQERSDPRKNRLQREQQRRMRRRQN